MVHNENLNFVSVWKPLIWFSAAGIDPVWTIHEPWRVITEQSLGFVLISKNWIEGFWEKNIFPVLLSILNLYAIDKYAGRFQVVVTISKMLSLAVIIFTGFYMLIFKGQKLLIRLIPFNFHIKTPISHLHSKLIQGNLFKVGHTI